MELDPRRSRSLVLALFLFVLCGLFAIVQADVILNWQPSPPADSVTSYSVFRSTDMGVSIETYWWGITDTFYVDSSLSKDTYYTYWILAYYKHGASSRSNEVYSFESSNVQSVASGELRLLAQPVGDSLEVRWSVETAMYSMLQYELVDGIFTLDTGEIEGPGPYFVMIPVTDTVRVCVWSGVGGESLTIYAPIAVSPPTAPEVEIAPFR
jgi:hypothetical protein